MANNAEEKNSEKYQSEEEEEEYVVEKILKHKLNRNNETLYFLKWKGYPLEDNTWEPASNLNCPELIDAYENDVKEKKRKSNKQPLEEKKADTSEERKKQQKRKTTDEGKSINAIIDTQKKSSKKKKKSEKKVTGFDKGMEAEEILGATETAGEVHFLIKWKGVNDAELVPSKTANIKIPQMVIAFYEARLTWSSTSSRTAENGDESKENSPTKDAHNKSEITAK